MVYMLPFPWQIEIEGMTTSHVLAWLFINIVEALDHFHNTTADNKADKFSCE